MAPERHAVVIEDDPDIRGLVTLVLRSAGLSVTEAADGLTGIDQVRRLEPEIVTLDLGLPDLDGIEVCRRLRTFSDAYLVMLTARAAEVDTLLGLESGADDYLVKPFSPRELAARVNAMLRRPRALASSAQPPSDTASGRLELGDLAVDEGRHLVTRGGTPVELTKTEYDLLLALLRSPDRVLSKAELLEQVWEITWAGDVHLVETHLGNLRRKLGERPGEGRYVRTVRGVGYGLGTG